MEFKISAIDRLDEIKAWDSAWKKLSPSRHGGGIHSHSGYSYQSAYFLIEFFRLVVAKTETELAFAHLETLSDVLQLKNEVIKLQQVKLNLSSGAATEILNEAYALTKLIEAQGGILMDRARFQVVCRRSNLNFTPHRYKDKIHPDADPEVWSRMIDRFCQPAVEVAADPIGELYQLFVAAGAREPMNLVLKCMGLVHESLMSGENGRELRVPLMAAFESGRQEGSIGSAVTLEALKPRNPHLTNMYDGSSPQISMIAAGAFMHRSKQIDLIEKAVDDWIDRVEEAERSDWDAGSKIPCFVIVGDSGCGKSVLLLQLMEGLIRSGSITSALHVTSPDQLPDLYQSRLRSIAQEPNRIPETLTLAFCDQAFPQSDAQGWSNRLDQRSIFGSAKLCFIGTATIAQLETLAEDVQSRLNITQFKLDQPDDKELDEFVEWAKLKTNNTEFVIESGPRKPTLAEFIHQAATGRTATSTIRQQLEMLNTSQKGAVAQIAACALVGLSIPKEILQLTQEHLKALIRCKLVDEIEPIGEISTYLTLSRVHFARAIFEESAPEGVSLLNWGSDIYSDLLTRAPETTKAWAWTLARCVWSAIPQLSITPRRRHSDIAKDLLIGLEKRGPLYQPWCDYVALVGSLRAKDLKKRIIITRNLIEAVKNRDAFEIPAFVFPTLFKSILTSGESQSWMSVNALEVVNNIQWRQDTADTIARIVFDNRNMDISKDIVDNWLKCNENEPCAGAVWNALLSRPGKNLPLNEASHWLELNSQSAFSSMVAAKLAGQSRGSLRIRLALLRHMSSRPPKDNRAVVRRFIASDFDNFEILARTLQYLASVEDLVAEGSVIMNLVSCTAIQFETRNADKFLADIGDKRARELLFLLSPWEGELQNARDRTYMIQNDYPEICGLLVQNMIIDSHVSIDALDTIIEITDNRILHPFILVSIRGWLKTLIRKCPGEVSMYIDTLDGRRKRVMIRLLKYVVDLNVRQLHPIMRILERSGADVQGDALSWFIYRCVDFNSVLVEVAAWLKKAKPSHKVQRRVQKAIDVRAGKQHSETQSEMKVVWRSEPLRGRDKPTKL